MAYRGYASHTEQLKIAKRDGWKCHYCGVKLIWAVAFSDIENEIREGNRESVIRYGSKSDRETLKDYESGAQMATIDHVVPISKGGSRTDQSNMVLSCRSCNSKKGAR